MEVEAREIQLLGLGHLLLGCSGKRKLSKSSRGDGAVELDAAVVEAEGGVGADAGGAKERSRRGLRGCRFCRCPCGIFSGDAGSSDPITRHQKK